MTKQMVKEFGNYAVTVTATQSPEGWHGICRIGESIRVSLISHEYSYGGKDGLWECITIIDDEMIHDSVSGYMTESMVGDYIERITK